MFFIKTILIRTKYLLSPYVDHMQIVETDSIRPQNKIGPPIGASDFTFLNIILLFKKKIKIMRVKRK